MPAAAYVSSPLTANGGATGILAIVSTTDLLVGAHVIIVAQGVEPRDLVISAIGGPTGFTVVDASAATVNLSAYTVAKRARVTQYAQRDINLVVAGTYVQRSGDTMTGALRVGGIVWSTAGGIKFPDNTIQTTATAGSSGLTSVTADSPLTGAGTSGSHLAIQTASASLAGALSSTDWSTFNSKQSSLLFTLPLQNSSGTIAIQTASTSLAGALSSTDWNTFNGKQNTLLFTLPLQNVSDTIAIANATPSNSGVMTPSAQAFAGTKTFQDEIVASSGVRFGDASLQTSAVSGTNTGDVTIGTANGLSLAGQVLSLAAAGATTTGAVTSGTQSFGGAKTFTGAISASNFSGSSSGTNSGTNSGDVTIGTANGLSLVSQALSMDAAGSSTTGVVTSSAQTFGGAKTFTGAIASSNFSGSSSGTNTGDVTIGTANGLSLVAQALSLDAAGASTTGVVTSGVQTFGGAKTFSAAISASNLSGTNTGDVTIGTANGLSLVAQALSMDPAGVAAAGIVTTSAQSFAGAKTFTGAISSSNFSGSSSGTNSGDITIGTANGLSLSGQALSMDPADSAVPGIVTAGAQSFGGAKTFVAAIAASNLSGTNSGDVTIGTANGLSLVAQALSLAAAGASTTGVVTSGTQSFGGAKTFTGTISASNFSGSSSGTNSGTNTGDVTIGTANGLSLVSQALSMTAAGVATTGVVTSSAQTFGGAKSFTGALAAASDGSASAVALSLGTTTDADTGFFHPGADILGVSTGGTERARFDAAGLVSIGDGTLTNVYGLNVSAGTGIGAFAASATAGTGAIFALERSRGSFASRTAMSAADTIGEVQFNGYTDARVTGATIRAVAATGWGSTGSDAPTDLVVLTSADGSATPTECGRWTSQQALLMGTVEPVAQRTLIGTSGTASTTTANMNSITTSTGTITVVSSTGFPSIGYAVILSGNGLVGEIVKYSVASATTLSITNRGRFATTAVTHSAAATIYWIIDLVATATNAVPAYMVTSSGDFILPKTSSDLFSTKVGLGANPSGSAATAVGGASRALGNSGSAYGYNSSASSTNSVAIGSGATGSATSAIALGSSSNASATSAIAFGVSAASAFANSIQIGQGSTTATNQVVIGGSTQTINDMYVGNGVSAATVGSIALNATGGSGSNIAGAAFTLAGGKGTGTGLGGNVVIATAPAGASSSSPNALVSRIIVQGDGMIALARATAPTSPVHIGGAVAYPTTSVSGNTTLDTTHSTVRFDATSGPLTAALPAASSCGGRTYTIKKIDASTNAVTVDANSSETIDGALIFVLATQHSSVTIQSNGTSWDIL